MSAIRHGREILGAQHLRHGYATGESGDLLKLRCDQQAIDAFLRERDMLITPAPSDEEALVMPTCDLAPCSTHGLNPDETCEKCQQYKEAMDKQATAVHKDVESDEAEPPAKKSCINDAVSAARAMGKQGTAVNKDVESDEAERASAADDNAESDNAEVQVIKACLKADSPATSNVGALSKATPSPSTPPQPENKQVADAMKISPLKRRRPESSPNQGGGSSTNFQGVGVATPRVQDIPFGSQMDLDKVYNTMCGHHDAVVMMVMWQEAPHPSQWKGIQTGKLEYHGWGLGPNHQWVKISAYEKMSTALHQFLNTLTEGYGLVEFSALASQKTFKREHDGALCLRLALGCAMRKVEN